MNARQQDVVVVGSGVAGALTALMLSHRGRARTALVSKSILGESNTRFAQGGVAVVQQSDDSNDRHFSDTIKAGAGLCDEDAVRTLVEGANDALSSLVEFGAVFDRAPSGEFSLSREGGHSVARVVHAGGAATGAEISRAVVEALRHSNVELLENTYATDVVVRSGRSVGVEVLTPRGERSIIDAGAVVLATGGAGQLYEVTTNPPGATGDGVAMALRAGATVCDMEFVQFHPTALDVVTWPVPLLSEALRGEGAVLRNSEGERFVDELASRDIVSRAIAQQLHKSGERHVFLDARPIGAFEELFPSLFAVLDEAGLDPAKDLLPVVPAAHYLCGGALTDLDGITTLPGLYAVGETACTGVEGANRLASNSLLEGMVFAERTAKAVLDGRDVATPTGAMGGLFAAPGAIAVRALDFNSAPRTPTLSGEVPMVDVSVSELRRELTHAMSRYVGIVRNEGDLVLAEDKLAKIAGSLSRRANDVATLELTNLVTNARVVAFGALARHETRGAHSRSDYPDRDDEGFRCRLGIVGTVSTQAALTEEIAQQ